MFWLLCSAQRPSVNPTGVAVCNGCVILHYCRSYATNGRSDGMGRERRPWAALRRHAGVIRRRFRAWLGDLGRGHCDAGDLVVGGALGHFVASICRSCRAVMRARTNRNICLEGELKLYACSCLERRHAAASQPSCGALAMA